jgi:hypothetical protein
VITGRNRLTALVAETGAEPVVLDPPDHDEAVALLHRRAGIRDADAIVDACGRLPLALALVGARIKQTGFAPELAALDDVRAVFSWSYQALPPGAGRLFGLLGLVAGGDIAMTAVAALAGMSQAEVRRTVRDLVDASLLTEAARGRFQQHDLLRAYARELAYETDPPAERHRALTRLLDHYTQTAYQAELVLNPSRAPIPLALEPPPVRRGTEAAARLPHRPAMAGHRSRRADVGAAAGRRRRPGPAGYERALDHERQAGDRANEAIVRAGLGQSRHALGRHEAAAEQFHEGLRPARQLGDPIMEAQLPIQLGDLARATRRGAQAGDVGVSR